MAQNTRLEIILDVQGKKYYLDTDGIESLPLTFNVQNLKDISQTKGSFSKTIVVPETKNNREVFNNITDLSADSSFNANLRNRAFVLVDSICIFEGYFQLSSFQLDFNNKKNTLSLYLTSDTSDFFTVLGEEFIEDLDLSAYNHVWDYVNVIQSWDKQYTSGYYYPLIDYGNDWTYANINNSGTNSYVKLDQMLPSIYARTIFDRIFYEAGFTYKSNSLDYGTPLNRLIIPFNGKTLEYSQEYADSHGFLVGSTFSLTAGQVMPLATTYSNTGHVAFSNVPASTFWSLQPGNSYSPWNDIYNGNAGVYYRVRFADETTSPFGDPNNLWSLSGYEYTNTSASPVTMRFNISLTLSMKLRYSTSTLPRIWLKRQYDGAGNYYPSGTPTQCADNWTSTLYLPVGRANSTIGANQIWSYLGWWDGTKIREGFYGTFYPPSGGPNPTPGYFSSNYEVRPGYTYDNTSSKYEIYTGTWNTPTITIKPGEKVWLEFEYQIAGDTQTNYSFPKNYTLAAVLGGSYQQTAGVGGITYSAFFPKSTFGNELSKQIVPGNEVLMSSVIPKQIKKRDYILSIIKMFNLIVEPDKDNPKLLKIETSDSYYASGAIKDWSSKVDFLQPIDVQVLGDTQNKRFTFKYKDDKDYLNTDYVSKTKKNYGQYQLLTQNEFADGEKKIELIFSPTPMAAVPYSNINYVTGGVGVTYSSIIIPKIFSVNNGVVQIAQSNIRILFKKKLTLQPNNYWWLQATTSPNYLIQNSVLPYAGHFNDPGASLSEDLNFGITDGLYFPTTQITSNNLYLKYWRKTIEEITDAESRIVSLYIYLTPQDIYAFKFNDKIYLNLSTDRGGAAGGQYYKVNKIESYDPTFIQPCKVELIKVKDITVPLPGNRTIGTTVTALPALVNTNSTTQYSLLASQQTNTSSQQTNVVSGSNNLLGGQLNTVDGNNTLVSGSGNTVSGGNAVVIGTGNRVAAIDNTTTTTNAVIGTNNTITNNVVQSVVLGNNVEIAPEAQITNAVAIGSNVKVYTSNTTVIGGIVVFSNNFVSGSRNEVLNPFSDNSSINYISGSRNTIRELGSFTNINALDAGRNITI